MIKDDIEILRSKLEEQILKNESYEEIYKTSVEIDKLLIDYYNEKSSAIKIS